MFVNFGFFHNQSLIHYDLLLIDDGLGRHTEGGVLFRSLLVD